MTKEYKDRVLSNLSESDRMLVDYCVERGIGYIVHCNDFTNSYYVEPVFNSPEVTELQALRNEIQSLRYDIQSLAAKYN